MDNNIKVKYDIEADSIFKGTKIYWRKNISGFIWFNDKEYKATIEDWYLFGFNECIGTLVAPYLSFKKVAEIPNAVTNNIQGLTILPYNESLKIKSSETKMITDNGKIVEGIGYDLNNDAILDIFSWTEELDETTSYTRLYMNINGQWKCKWIRLDELCI